MSQANFVLITGNRFKIILGVFLSIFANSGYQDAWFFSHEKIKKDASLIHYFICEEKRIGTIADILELSKYIRVWFLFLLDSK